MRKTVLILGGSGLLGSSLCCYLKTLDYIVFTLGRSIRESFVLDPTDETLFLKVLNEINPEYVINLIAATDVDYCELNVEMAFRINALVPFVVSKVIAENFEHSPYFIQISTDQVYPGNGNHNEDEVSPVNVYGLTKYTGELMARNLHMSIIRTNFFGKSLSFGKKSFSDWAVDLLQNNKPAILFEDVRFSALHMSSLCEIIHKMMLAKLTGIFNVGCRDGISKAEYILTLAKELKLSTSSVHIGSMLDAKFKARRPLDMTMKIGKLEKALGIDCPSIAEEIKKTTKEYLNA
jgi:dTDP-4-dehydrorhamnose reductase